MINVSYFLWLNREVHQLMLRYKRGCMTCQLNFYHVYKYGTNTWSFRLKTGSRKYGRDTPLPASRPVPSPYFSVNTEMGRINIKIRTVRDGTRFCPSIFDLKYRVVNHDPPWFVAGGERMQIIRLSTVGTPTHPASVAKPQLAIGVSRPRWKSSNTI